MTDTKAPTRPVRIAATVIAAVIGAIAVGTALAATLGTVAIEWAAIATVLTLGAFLSFYDYRERRLPDMLTFPLYGAVSGLWGVSSATSGDLGRLALAAAAGVLLWLLYFVLAMLGGVAYGDVKLAGALGLFVGWWGIIPALLATAAAYFFALPHGVASIVTSRERRKQDPDSKKTRPHIPFGPYMVAGALAVALVNTIG